MKFFNDAEIGGRLRQYREKVLNISSRRFALKAQVDVSLYAKIESGTKPLSEKMMLKILFTYKDLTRDYLLFGEKMEMAGKAGPAVQISSEETNRFKDTVALATGLLKVMPKVKTSQHLPEQVRLYKQRESKYEMAVALLLNTIDELLENQTAKPK
jgi:transcriptional regulator with XRE-family HTH domain